MLIDSRSTEIVQLTPAISQRASALIDELALSNCMRLADDPAARPLVSLVFSDDLAPQEFGRLFGVYRSKRQATQALHALADSHALCPSALGLEAANGRCFSHQLRRCKGVCCGQESPERHRLRVELALAAQRLHAWPHAGKVGLREHDPASGRTDIHVFDQWCHLATVHDEAELHDALQARDKLAFDLDTYRLLLKRLMASGKVDRELIRFTPGMAAVAVTDRSS